MRKMKQILGNYELADFIVRCNFDFSFFSERVLGLELSKFHREIMKLVQDENNQQILIVLPRGHLKTTIFSVAYPIWRAWREGGKDICLVSSSLDQSAKSIEDIQFRIISNEFLKDLIPRNRENAWNKSKLVTSNMNKIYNRPYNSSARGVHPDYLILDDILRDDKLNQEQIKDIFFSVFYPMSNMKRFQKIIVGTPMTINDLFIDLEQSKDWITVKKPAVLTDDSGNWIEPLWKEHFTLDKLKSIKNAMGSLRFSREFLCNPIGGGSSIFSEELFEDHENGGILYDGENIQEPEPNGIYYLGVDVAVETARSSDYLVFVILQEIENNLKVVRIDRFKKGWSPTQLRQYIHDLNQKFNFRKITMERNGLNIGYFKEAMNDPSLKSILVGIEYSSYRSKEELIANLQAKCESRSLLVLNNPVLIEEMGSFVYKEGRDGRRKIEGIGKHDDIVMALAFAVWGASDRSRRTSMFWI